MPYRGDVRARFPHGMEFQYLAYSDLVKGMDAFDWSPLEAMLDDIASRGHQAVFRVFLEYPGKTGVIPPFLVAGGLRVHVWTNTNTQPFPPEVVETPDYEDANLRRSLANFVAALGQRYDGDPRIGFVTAGLLGTWGEWHTHPREELFASEAVQREVMDAYEAAFTRTPVLLRYPAGPNAHRKADNSARRFGYHDDSFAWATLHTGKPGEEWFFMTALASAGPAAEAKWKTSPIGGEIRPEAWGRVFDEEPGLPEIQDFRACVEATHATWLMDTGMFRGPRSEERIRRAERAVRRMGYEFHARAVETDPVHDGRLRVRLEIENRGVAPLYHDWRAEWGLLRDGSVERTAPVSGTLTALLPGDAPREWEDTLDVTGLAAGTFTLAVRVPNPLSGGRPLRFANETQAADGWLALGEVPIR